MKYGYNDYDWNAGISDYNKFCSAVTAFNLNGFIPMMKRKTVNDTDKIMLKALKEMVGMLDAKMNKGLD